MDRRAFLKGLLGVTAVTAAGLLVPSRTTYCFLTENPLAPAEYGTQLGVRWQELKSLDAMLKEAYRPMLERLLNQDAILFDRFTA